MEKWYGCSTRMYPVTTWCEAIGRQNRASECQVRLPVSFREETARIYLWQIVEEGS